MLCFVSMLVLLCCGVVRRVIVVVGFGMLMCIVSFVVDGLLWLRVGYVGVYVLIVVVEALCVWCLCLLLDWYVCLFV